MSADIPVLAVVVSGAAGVPGSERLLDSLLAQTDAAWELAVVGGVPSSWPADTRVRAVVSEGSPAGAVDGFVSRTTAELVTVLRPTDALAPGSVAALRAALAAGPDASIVYSDEDRVDPDGRHLDPWYKPAWSPDRLLAHNYLGRLCAFRPESLLSAGGFSAAIDPGEQPLTPGGLFSELVEYDAVLRVSEIASCVVHVPRILYHRSVGGASEVRAPAPPPAACAAVVQRHIDRLGMPAMAVAPGPGPVRLSPVLRDRPVVSLVVPTACAERKIAGRRVGLLGNLLRSLARTTYRPFETVIVVDRDTDPLALERALADAGDLDVRLVRHQEPFHFSRACNLGAQHATGEVLVFLNDDTEIVQPDWLDRLVLWSGVPGVGAVGARLHYPDGRVQHAGIYCRRGWPVHRYWRYPGDDPGYHDALAVPHDVLAATAACLAIRSGTFASVGGFSMRFPNNFNDVDLCLKLRHRGLRVVQDNQTVLRHLESATRTGGIEHDEHERFLARWADLVQEDPYDNPNLDGPEVEELPAPASLSIERERWEPREPRVWSADRGWTVGGVIGFGG